MAGGALFAGCVAALAVWLPVCAAGDDDGSSDCLEPPPGPYGMTCADWDPCESCGGVGLSCDVLIAVGYDCSCACAAAAGRAGEGLVLGHPWVVYALLCISLAALAAGSTTLPQAVVFIAAVDLPAPLVPDPLPTTAAGLMEAFSNGTYIHNGALSIAGDDALTAAVGAIGIVVVPVLHFAAAWVVSGFRRRAQRAVDAAVVDPGAASGGTVAATTTEDSVISIHSALAAGTPTIPSQPSFGVFNWLLAAEAGGCLHNDHLSSAMAVVHFPALTLIATLPLLAMTIRGACGVAADRTNAAWAHGVAVACIVVAAAHGTIMMQVLRALPSFVTYRREPPAASWRQQLWHAFVGEGEWCVAGELQHGLVDKRFGLLYRDCDGRKPDEPLPWLCVAGPVVVVVSVVRGIAVSGAASPAVAAGGDFTCAVAFAAAAVTTVGWRLKHRLWDVVLTALQLTLQTAYAIIHGTALLQDDVTDTRAGVAVLDAAFAVVLVRAVVDAAAVVAAGTSGRRQRLQHARGSALAGGKGAGGVVDDGGGGGGGGLAPHAGGGSRLQKDSSPLLGRHGSGHGVHPHHSVDGSLDNGGGVGEGSTYQAVSICAGGCAASTSAGRHDGHGGGGPGHRGGPPRRMSSAEAHHNDPRNPVPPAGHATATGPQLHHPLHPPNASVTGSPSTAMSAAGSGDGFAHSKRDEFFKRNIYPHGAIHEDGAVAAGGGGGGRTSGGAAAGPGVSTRSSPHESKGGSASPGRVHATLSMSMSLNASDYDLSPCTQVSHAVDGYREAVRAPDAGGAYAAPGGGVLPIDPLNQTRDESVVELSPMTMPSPAGTAREKLLKSGASLQSLPQAASHARGGGCGSQGRMSSSPVQMLGPTRGARSLPTQRALLTHTSTSTQQTHTTVEHGAELAGKGGAVLSL